MEAMGAQLDDLVAATGLPEGYIVERAIAALHRAWIGDDPRQHGIPFKKRYSDRDADVVLRQLDARTFVLAEGFRYHGQTVEEGGPPTDLTSVPSVLRWLVQSYGRHSLPALLHDVLIEETTPPDERDRADAIFREAMAEMRVPFVRRWMMWAAVSLASTFRRSRGWRAMSAAWVLAYVAATVVLVLVRPAAPVVAAVLLSPLVLALAWRDRYRVGLISAYGVLVLTVPTAAVSASTGVYLVSEKVAQLVLRALGRPAYPVSLSKLPGYGKRTARDGVGSANGE